MWPLRAKAEVTQGLHVTLTLHGVTRTLQVPVQLERSADSLAVAGRVALKQTDFAIAPLSVLGGAIQVQDEVTVRFRIRARATTPAQAPTRETAATSWSADPRSTGITLARPPDERCQSEERWSC